jgi:polysaccharide pyruvyl transferase WcaK-like protein
MQSMQITPVTMEADPQSPGPRPRIALVTPYSGGNLGDAAIQDSMISNLRQRIPGAQFLGITLNGDNFLAKHGDGAFPLLASRVPFRYQSRKDPAQKPDGTEGSSTKSDDPAPKKRSNPLRSALRTMPGVGPLLKRARTWVSAVRREILHSIAGYRVLRTQDLLVISGGGQFDEEFGGAWRLPFAFFKWALVARAAGVQCVVASVGAGRIVSPGSRIFISMVLRMSCYRSYRDWHSRAILAKLVSSAASDSVVADLAFSMPDSELPPPTGAIRKLARGRPVVVLSPMAYAKPLNWPTPNRALYDRYVQQMARVLRGLTREGYFVVVACSSLGDDETVIPDLMGGLGDEVTPSLDGQIHFPPVKTWKDFVAVMRDADYLVASRLHGTILGFVAQTPAVAISVDPKVDWVMEDLGQTDSVLQFRDFTAEDVLSAIERIKVHRDAVVERIASYRQGVLLASQQQYDSLARLALAHHN